jgi:hypothetical protein
LFLKGKLTTPALSSVFAAAGSVDDFFDIGEDIAAAIASTQADPTREARDFLLTQARSEYLSEYAASQKLHEAEASAVQAEGGLDPSASPALHEMVLQSLADDPLHWIAKGAAASAAVASQWLMRPMPPPPPPWWRFVRSPPPPRAWWMGKKPDPPAGK